jgi:HAD superfamily phosphatase (TIGR01668 family)
MVNNFLIKNLLPDYRFKRIIDISPDFFIKAELIIFDVDNTLVFSGTIKSTNEVIEWFAQIKNKYHCICISNNGTIFNRAKDIANLLGCEIFLSKHKKPFKKLWKEVKVKYNIDKANVFVVGDRMFTDILFGNLNGLTTILVNPLSSREHILIRIVRKIEAVTLFLLDFLIYNEKNKRI